MSSTNFVSNHFGKKPSSQMFGKLVYTSLRVLLSQSTVSLTFSQSSESYFFAGNNGCGICFLDGSHPLIHNNRIKDSGDTGLVFVNDTDPDHEMRQIRLHYNIHSPHATIKIM